MIPTASRLGLAQVVFSPLAQGVLTGKYKSDETLPAYSRGADSRVNSFMLVNLNRETLVLVEKLSKLAAEEGLTMPSNGTTLLFAFERNHKLGFEVSQQLP